MKQGFKEILGYVFSGITIIVYFVLLSILENPPVLNILQYFGWISFVTGIIFMVLAIATLLKNHTKAVINRGIYSIVRHPLYLGAMFLFLAMGFFLPHWIMIILSAVNIMYIYWFMIVEDKKNIEKFDDNYKQYMQFVPRVNFLYGLIRQIYNKERKK